MNHRRKCLPLGLMMAGSLFAATQAWALPLGDSFYNVGTEGDARMRQIAQAQADGERTIYKSTKEEQQNFQGFFIPASNTTKLAVLSDDGVTIDIDNVITNVQNAGKGQHGPSLAESLHTLDYTFKAGQVYRINIAYTNTIYSGDGDLDGMTLFAYDGGGRVQEVNLIISSGLNSSAVSEDDEETVGAFTVANLNDTDGDGVIDNVVGTAGGRNEVDLMALDITRPAGPATDTLSVRILSGQARLWQQPTKGTLVPLNANGAAEFALGDLPKRIWVEATAVSQTTQDIAIQLDYKGKTDTVKATGVWAQQTAVEHDRLPALDILNKYQDIANPPSDLLTLLDGTGLLPITTVLPNGDSYTGNGILLQYTVLPAGIQNYSRIVRFDVSRQAESDVWARSNTNAAFNLENLPPFGQQFPLQDEGANDDPLEQNGTETDESDAVTAIGHLYSYDAPGFRKLMALPTTATQIVIKASFREFVRVDFNGNRPAGTGVSGSRCANKYAWHARHYLVKAPQGAATPWQRLRGDAAETEQDDVAPGSIPVTTPPVTTP